MTQLASYTEQLTGKPQVSYEEFLALPSDVHAEWVDGEVVFMPSVSELHSRMGSFLLKLLGILLDDHPVGRVFYEPFQIRMGGRPSGRAPDVIFLRTEHLDRLHRLYIEGPADLVVEIVSRGNASNDYIEKFQEYEAAGVQEYWIIDPEGPAADFFVLGSNGKYERVLADAEGVYRSTAIPGVWFRVTWLWERPGVRTILAEIEAMASAPS